MNRSSPLSIRAASPGEYERIGELIVESYESIPDAVSDPDYYLEVRRVAERAAVVPVLVVLDATARLVGSLTFVPGPGAFAEIAAPNEAEIRMFAVAAAARGAGIGGALLDHAIERAVALGRSGIVLSTSPWMSAAQRLYCSRGFERDEALDHTELSSGTSFELWGYRLRL